MVRLGRLDAYMLMHARTRVERCEIVRASVEPSASGFEDSSRTVAAPDERARVRGFQGIGGGTGGAKPRHRQHGVTEAHPHERH